MPEGLHGLQTLVEENGFTAYDAVLWDVYSPLIDLAKEGHKQLHASTSDYRNYEVPTYLAKFLFEMSEQVPVYFKCDEVDKARQVLTSKIPLIMQDRQERIRLGESIESSLGTHLPKPEKPKLL